VEKGAREMRLIDADALKSDLYKAKNINITVGEIIDNQPTIEDKYIEVIEQEIRKLEWYGDDAFWDGVNAVSEIIDKYF
jgi:hypothetical protein